MFLALLKPLELLVLDLWWAALWVIWFGNATRGTKGQIRHISLFSTRDSLPSSISRLYFQMSLCSTLGNWMLCTIGSFLSAKNQKSNFLHTNSKSSQSYFAWQMILASQI